MIHVTTYLLSYLMISENLLGISSSSSGSGRNDENKRRRDKGKTKVSNYEPIYNAGKEDLWEIAKYMTDDPIRARKNSNDQFTPLQQPAQKLTYAPVKESIGPQYVWAPSNPVAHYKFPKHPSSHEQMVPKAGENTTASPHMLKYLEELSLIGPDNSAHDEFSIQFGRRKRRDTPRPPRSDYGVPVSYLKREKSKSFSNRVRKVDNDPIIMKIDDKNDFRNMVHIVTGEHNIGRPFVPLGPVLPEESNRWRRFKEESEKGETSKRQKPRDRPPISRKPSASAPSDPHAENEWYDFPPFDPDFLKDPPYRGGHQPPHP